MSQCPLIIYATVEIHHPNRVTRQFGIRQGIPEDISHSHEMLQSVTRRGRSGVAWSNFHDGWVTYWQNRATSRIQGYQINGGSSTEDGYMEWYRRITRLRITPSHLEMETGYQPSDITSHDAISNWMRRLRLGANDDSELWPHLRRVVMDISDEMEKHIRSSQNNASHTGQDAPAADTTTTTQYMPTTFAPPDEHMAGPSRSTPQMHHDVAGPSHGYGRYYYVPQYSQTDSYFFTPPVTGPSWTSYTSLLQSDTGMPSHHFSSFDQSRVGRPEFHTSPVAFRPVSSVSTTHDDDEDDDDTQSVQATRHRSRRQRQHPRCGTGGHRY